MTSKYASIMLDRSRPFGVVFPPENNAHYAQDGLHFTAEGELAEEWLSPDDRARLDKMIARKAADAAGEKARREALEKAGFGADEISAIAQAAAKTRATPEKSGADNGVDLKAWGEGKINIAFFKVKQAIIDKYARNVENMQDALDFLIDEHVISEASARRIN